MNVGTRPVAGEPGRQQRGCVLAAAMAVVLLVLGISPATDADPRRNGRRHTIEVMVVEPFPETAILPDSPMAEAPGGREITIEAAPGEYEPASLVVRAPYDVRDLMLRATNFRRGESVLPAKSMDIRVVKCWYQAGHKIYDTARKLLVPELLLRDDDLVSVNLQTEENFVAVNKLGIREKVLISGPPAVDLRDLSPKDSPRLLPVSLPADTNKQFWLTWRAPEDAAPGVYSGAIVLQSGSLEIGRVAVKVRILPFRLEPPSLVYAMYYRGRIGRFMPGTGLEGRHVNDRGRINSNWKTPTQYAVEMANMREHGIVYPTMYQNDLALVGRELSIRREAGLPVDALFWVNARPGSIASVDEVKWLRQRVATWHEAANRLGFQNVFWYGIDEAKGRELDSQQLAWRTVREAGGFVFAAIEKGQAAGMGSYLDVAVVPGPLEPGESAAYHAIGRRVFSYSNPQAGEETPAVYRRNYGVALWRAGYDGAMLYAYQHSANHIWNDFDDKKYRDHVMAYPTVDGVIDTLQFEGLREGIDDVRYLTTLQLHVRHAPPQKRGLAAAAEAWMRAIDSNIGYRELRSGVVEWIQRLTAEAASQ